MKTTLKLLTHTAMVSALIIFCITSMFSQNIQPVQNASKDKSQKSNAQNQSDHKSTKEEIVHSANKVTFMVILNPKKEYKNSILQSNDKIELGIENLIVKRLIEYGYTDLSPEN